MGADPTDLKELRRVADLDRLSRDAIPNETLAEAAFSRRG